MQTLRFIACAFVASVALALPATADSTFSTSNDPRAATQAVAALLGADRGLRVSIGSVNVSADIGVLGEAYHEALPRAMSRAAAEVVTRDPALVGGPS